MDLLKKAIRRANETQERLAMLLADSEDTPQQLKERDSELFSFTDNNGTFIINY